MTSFPRLAKRLGLYLGIAVLGFLAGVHVLYVLWALNGPPLQPWHEIELAAEFTADQADQVRTLADYQALEARLFAELAHLTRVMGGKPVHIIGYSMGAALAVDYSLNARAGTPLPPPASLALISPAVGLARIADLTPWVERLGRLPGLGRLAWTAIMPEFDPFRYNSFTANASLQVHRMTQDLTTRLRRLATPGPLTGFPPTLVLLSAVDATVSAQAVADQLLRHLAPEGHELVLYDINRFALDAPLVVADAGELTERLLADATLPFAVTFIHNLDADTRQVLAERKPPFTAGFTTGTPLDAPWPDEVIALSHIALPFPPDDPLYGRQPPADPSQVFLGQLAIRGENGVLKLPGNWLLRQRHNPFYDYQQQRILDWFDQYRRGQTDLDRADQGQPPRHDEGSS